MRPRTPCVMLYDVHQGYAAPIRAVCEELEFSVRFAEAATSATLRFPAVLAVAQLHGSPANNSEAVRALQKHLRGIPLVLLAWDPPVGSVVEWVKDGVADVLPLPGAPESIARKALSHALDPKDDLDDDQLVGRSPEMCRLRRDIGAVAQRDTTVLVRGETGTGKGLVARILHDASRRSAGPFVHVDCAGLAATLIESELFGHERGAFTGALTRHVGYFQAAEQGTIFLDEVGELPPRLQAKFLRILEDRTYMRVGGTTSLAMTARVIAATHRDLEGDVQSGRFRADLYFRLKVFDMYVPPLRDRVEDVPLLARRFLGHLGRRLGISVPAVSPCFYRSLSGYHWPGNVRELIHVLERTLVRNPNRVLDGQTLEDLLAVGVSEPVRAIAESPSPATAQDTPWAPLDDPVQVRDALNAARGSLAAAARTLRVPRTTLRRRVERFQLSSLVRDGRRNLATGH